MAVRTYHLIMGQSNARGAALKSALTNATYDLTQTDVRQWTRLDGVFSGTTSAAMTIPSTLFSIEAAYGYKLRHTSGEYPLIWRSGGNGYSLKTTYNPDAGTSEWADSIEQFWTCYQAAKTEFSGDTFRFGALVWIQGEADAQTHTWALDYVNELVTLGTVFRGEFGASLPIIFVQLSTSCGVTLEQPTDLTTMRAAYVTAAATLGNCAVVDASSIPLQGDNVHYTADGLMTLGEAVHAAYATLSAGTQHSVTARAFSVQADATTYATSAQTLLGARDENPANGGFGARLGSACKNPWPTTLRSAATEKHPYRSIWYVPVDGPMAASALDTTTGARPVDLTWLRAA